MDAKGTESYDQFEIEVIEFGREDVIVTSACPPDRITCPSETEPGP